jgi:hypothetical protein
VVSLEGDAAQSTTEVRHDRGAAVRDVLGADPANDVRTLEVTSSNLSGARANHIDEHTIVLVVPATDQ